MRTGWPLAPLRNKGMAKQGAIAHWRIKVRRLIGLVRLESEDAIVDPQFSPAGPTVPIASYSRKPFGLGRSSGHEGLAGSQRQDKQERIRKRPVCEVPIPAFTLNSSQSIGLGRRQTNTTYSAPIATPPTAKMAAMLRCTGFIKTLRLAPDLIVQGWNACPLMALSCSLPV